MAKKPFAAVCLTSLLLIMPASALAERQITLLKIDPSEKAAVIRAVDGKLDVIREGDVFETFGKVIAVLRERILLERQNEKRIIELSDGVQKVNRITKAPPALKQKMIISSNASGTSGTASGFKNGISSEAEITQKKKTHVK